jgi:hypothetical protein
MDIEQKDFSFYLVGEHGRVLHIFRNFWKKRSICGVGPPFGDAVSDDSDTSVCVRCAKKYDKHLFDITRQMYFDFWWY